MPHPVGVLCEGCAGAARSAPTRHRRLNGRHDTDADRRKVFAQRGQHLTSVFFSRSSRRGSDIPNMGKALSIGRKQGAACVHAVRTQSKGEQTRRESLEHQALARWRPSAGLQRGGVDMRRPAAQPALVVMSTSSATLASSRREWALTLVYSAGNDPEL